VDLAEAAAQAEELVQAGSERELSQLRAQWDDEVEHASLAAFCFSDAERTMLADVPATKSAAAFYAGWTRKEAYIKATGLGVSQGLDHFDVTLAPDTQARLLRDRHIPGANDRWTMHELAVGFGYSGALVAEGTCWRLERYAFAAHDGRSSTRASLA